jgi:hypothetical protein
VARCVTLPFDVRPELVSVAWGRRDSVRLGAARLDVVDLESLLQLELLAGSPRDLLDAAMLTLLHPEVEPRAREFARLRRGASMAPSISTCAIRGTARWPRS